jgi:hypothetical protein
MEKIYLDKANKTHKSHSWGYANTWGITQKNLDYYRSTGKPYTGNFSKDYNCSVDALAKAFEAEVCPICNRTYASMAAGKKGVVANPLWHKTFHIWYQIGLWYVGLAILNWRGSLLKNGSTALPHKANFA